MRVRSAKSFTAIACCTFCGVRNILGPSLVKGPACIACRRILEFQPTIDCPHCAAKSISISIGKDAAIGSYLMCPNCHRQIADGIPVLPERADWRVWLGRAAFEVIDDILAAMTRRQIKFRYQPRVAEAEFLALKTSWRAECGTREMERQGQPRPNENDLTVYAHPHQDEVMSRSRLNVRARHLARMGKYGQLITTFLAVANGKIYQDEYGDEIWDGAKREIERLIDGKVFKAENIRDRGEFYSFEFLSRCEPNLAGEYSDCWLYDELYDRLKAYHKKRREAVASGSETDFTKMSGIEFEEWMIAAIKRAGIPDARPTVRTGDQGADIIVRHGRTLIIQAKCYRDVVGNGAIQEVHAAKTHYGGDEAWVVTNSRFTRAARQLATSTSVRLIDASSVRAIGVLVAEALNPASKFAATTAESGPTDRPASYPLAVGAAAPTSLSPRGTAASLPVSSTFATLPPALPLTSPDGSAILTVRRQSSRSKGPLIISVALLFAIFLTGLYLYNRHRGKVDAELGARKALALWTSTMVSNDLSGQVDCYGPTVEPFFQHPRVTVQVVADEKAKLMKTYPVVTKYAISNIEFEKIEPDFVQLSLDKTWEAKGSRRFAGSEREVLKLRPIDGKWRIVAETEMKIYWVQTK